MTRRCVLLAICLLLPTCAADERADFFEAKIRPLLIDRCVACHGPDKQESGLRLDSREQVLSGTEDFDRLVEPGNLQDSRLWQVVQYSADDTQMPPKAKLADNELKLLQTWISSGAFWPEQSKFGSAKAVDPNAWKKHWAFQPIVDPPRPDFGNDNWHPIDRFVRHRLQENASPDKGTAAPLADGSTLVKRLAFVTTGLPPAASDLADVSKITDPAEQQQWLNQYTDRLIAEAAFGERWARHWLDVARYADTKGYVFQEDRNYKNAWRYREWVINAMNADMPYNEFLIRQIAGDQMPGADDPNQIAAMGFLTLGRRFINNKHDIIDDRIDVLSRGTMGLTVSCARCHDHKFDPIPTADYYSLYGVFDSSDEPKDSMKLVDRPKPREPHIFVRGRAGNNGPRVTRHFLTAISKNEPEPFKNGSGRLELAQKIASAENPLTARVAVNRIWIRLFGKGLVDSPSDFGVRTARPVQAELLDHLAAWLIQHNWSRKALIRYILVSHTWKQSSDARPALKDIDPDNKLWHRMEVRRRDFESFRDCSLAAAGVLERTVGGESVEISKPPYSHRRTVYARVERQNLPSVFRTFDFASPQAHVGQRFQTTVPQQALYQWNSPFLQSLSADAAQHAVSANSELSGQQTVDALFRQILLRAPSASELESATALLKSASGEKAASWQYGVGEIDEALARVLRFTPYPVFADGTWRGNTGLPDKTIGWSSLTATGGHPGHTRVNCAIRRWVAADDCELAIAGEVGHASDQGDGVTALVISHAGQLAKAGVFNNRKKLQLDRVSIKAGEAINFVVYAGATESFDSFEWKIQLTILNEKPPRIIKSADQFTGQAAQMLTPAAQLAQALMMSNEFMFVD